MITTVRGRPASRGTPPGMKGGPVADVPTDPFGHFESLLTTWLQGARLREIARLLELVAEALRRRA